MTAQHSLSELAGYLQAELVGDPACKISSMASLDKANPGQITFLLSPSYEQYLPTTKASAVVLNAKHRSDCPVNTLVMDDPKLGYAKLAQLFAKQPRSHQGIHKTAVIGEGCEINDTVSIGPNVVIGNNVNIGANTIISAGCVIDDDCVIGEDCLLAANVTFYTEVKIGQRTIIHSGVVIGSDGFGLVNDQGRWLKIPQLGGVIIGNDVEIGANTTIDRGALDNTVIEDGVKLDNLIQVAHNVHIGAHTAMAGCVGVAGSAKIGRHCLVGGAAGISDHVDVADGTIISAATVVSKSITEPGIYSSSLPMQPRSEWTKNAVQFRRLNELVKRVKKLERQADE